ncbi:MAG: DUF4173 domain-containing protein [Flavobacteriales bacterium]|nr:DUF4173 domain-containing protein [Flavobacteriales bacterium]
MNAIASWIRSRSALIIALLSAFIFDRLFFQMGIGLNLALFAVLMVVLIAHRIGLEALSLPARWAMLGTVVAALMVAVHGSVIAPIMAVLGLIWSSAMGHERTLRSIPLAFSQALANYVSLPIATLDGTNELLPKRGAARTGWRWARLSVIPLLVLAIFFQLYRVGNPKFDHLTAGFLDGIWQVVAQFFELVFTAHALFFLFGLFVCAGMLFRFAPKLVAQWEEGMSDAMRRIRVNRPHWLAPLAMDPLERERRRGIVLLALVNVLLLVVNIIDIDWVWFGFTVPEDFSLKQFVHEGTWALIFSILLSIVVVLWFFRGNQNFYWRNAWLKRLALLWVVQNGILAVSVFLRNWHYIGFHGLAYKRIGVIVFLALVLVGLVTLFIKVRERRTLYYLVRVNTWAAFAMLIGLTTVDWDSFIVRVNLRHSNPGEIDIDNYLAMSDKVLPLLYANIGLVEQQMERHKSNRVRWVGHLEPQAFRTALDAKRDRFMERMQAQHWQEWTWSDARTLSCLKEKAVVAVR